MLKNIIILWNVKQHNTIQYNIIKYKILYKTIHINIISCFHPFIALYWLLWNLKYILMAKAYHFVNMLDNKIKSYTFLSTAPMQTYLTLVTYYGQTLCEAWSCIIKKEA